MVRFAQKRHDIGTSGGNRQPIVGVQAPHKRDTGRMLKIRARMNIYQSTSNPAPTWFDLRILARHKANRVLPRIAARDCKCERYVPHY